MTWSSAFDVATSRLGTYQRLAAPPVTAAAPQAVYGPDAWQPSNALAAAPWPQPAAPLPPAWLPPAAPLPPVPPSVTWQPPAVPVPPPPPPMGWQPPAQVVPPPPPPMAWEPAARPQPAATPDATWQPPVVAAPLPTAPAAWQLPDMHLPASPQPLAPEPAAPKPKPAAPTRPQPAGPLEVGPIGALTWQHAVDVVRSRGGAVFRNGRPTVLAIRTGQRHTRAWEDHLVVLKPNGEMKVFAGTTRPATRSTAGSAMLVPGSYELTPRWKDAKWRNAFIVRDTDGDMTVAVARDRNGDGRYASSEFTRPSTSSLIRLHPGSSSGGPSSSGCLNVRDYQGFIRFLGGTEVRFDMTLVNA